jgi:hypothetical protein
MGRIPTYKKQWHVGRQNNGTKADIPNGTKAKNHNGTEADNPSGTKAYSQV